MSGHREHLVKPLINNPLSEKERALMPEVILPPDVATALELRASETCLGTCQFHHEEA